MTMKTSSLAVCATRECLDSYPTSSNPYSCTSLGCGILPSLRHTLSPPHSNDCLENLARRIRVFNRAQSLRGFHLTCRYPHLEVDSTWSSDLHGSCILSFSATVESGVGGSIT